VTTTAPFPINRDCRFVARTIYPASTSGLRYGTDDTERTPLQWQSTCSASIAADMLAGACVRLFVTLRLFSTVALRLFRIPIMV
jgi:hypothetical protein